MNTQSPESEDARLSRAYDQLLNQYVPTGFLIDDNRNLLHTFGEETNKYISPPTGRMSPDVLNMLGEDLQAPLVSTLQRAGKELTPITSPDIVRKSNGSEYTLNIVVTPVEDTLIKTPLYLVSFEKQEKSPKPESGDENLTESEENTPPLTANEEEMMDSLPIFIICKDLMGNITYANKQFCQMQGLPYSEVIGKKDNDLFPSELAEKYRLDDLEFMKTGRIHQVVEKHQIASGKQIEVLVLKSPLKSPDGTTNGLSIVFLDITEMMQNEHELENSNKKLKLFAKETTQKLRSPLVAIHNLAHWIEEDTNESLTESSKKNIQSILDRVKLMANQLDDLLQLSQQKQDEERMEEIPLSKFIIELLDSIQKPENFRVRIEGEMPVLKAQSDALSRVFENLLINAIQHHDREDGKVRISYRDQGDFYEFRISDDGPGIPEENRTKVFDLFHTLQPETQTQTHSTGIGLYLVRKTLEFQGGNIEIEATETRGTTFKITWPKVA